MATVPFTFRLDEEVKIRLEEEAKTDERSASYIASRAIKKYLYSRNYERMAIQEAVKEANKGVFVSSKSMRAWMASWGTDDEIALPKPDIFLEKIKQGFYGCVSTMSKFFLQVQKMPCPNLI